MGNSSENTGAKVFTVEQIKSWGMVLLEKLPISKEGAEDILDVLLQANVRGVDTHGIIRLVDYVKRLQNAPFKEIEIIKDGKLFTLIDGHNGPGPIVGRFAMNSAINKAKIHGNGFAAVRGSNHFSTAAYYSLMACNANMIGITMSTASPRIAPWGGLDAVIGNNPWSVAFPGYDFPIVLDMANTVVAMGKIRTCLREKKPLDPGWAMDSNGNPTTDPVAANDGLLMPIGAHKGVAISMMVDLLTGALSQSNAFSCNVNRVETSSKPQNVSHIFAAIDMTELVSLEDFKANIKRYADIVKSVRRKEGCNAIYLPGEIEWDISLSRLRDGIKLSDKTIEQLNDLAGSVGVIPLS
ncbi:lactate dehydrogenase [Synergistales bacterium]|nr:lactate dehydrogenase [Synergistales bacterium]